MQALARDSRCVPRRRLTIGLWGHAGPDNSSMGPYTGSSHWVEAD